MNDHPLILEQIYEWPSIDTGTNLWMTIHWYRYKSMNDHPLIQEQIYEWPSIDTGTNLWMTIHWYRNKYMNDHPLIQVQIYEWPSIDIGTNLWMTIHWYRNKSMNDHPLITYRLGIFSIIVYEVFLKESMLNLVGLHLPHVTSYLGSRSIPLSKDSNYAVCFVPSHFLFTFSKNIVFIVL